MFANIKPISIKNIFKKQMNAKVSTNNKKIKDKSFSNQSNFEVRKPRLSTSKTGTEGSYVPLKPSVCLVPNDRE